MKDEDSNTFDMGEKPLYFIVYLLLLLIFYFSYSQDNINSSVAEKEYSVIDKSSDQVMEELNAKLGSLLVDLSAVAISKQKGTDFYALKAENGMIFYTDKNTDSILVNRRDGTTTLFGLKDEGLVDLLDGAFDEFNKKITSEIESNSNGVVYRAENEKAKIFVFIDPYCAYCQKLNSELDQYLDLGITVEFLPFPIYGPRSEDAMSRVWSLPSIERPGALQKLEKYARDNPHIQDLSGLDLPVGNQSGIDEVSKYRGISLLLGLAGTPGIYVEGGELIKGYIPANVLAERLGILD